MVHVNKVKLLNCDLVSAQKCRDCQAIWQLFLHTMQLVIPVHTPCKLRAPYVSAL